MRVKTEQEGTHIFVKIEWRPTIQDIALYKKCMHKITCIVLSRNVDDHYRETEFVFSYNTSLCQFEENVEMEEFIFNCIMCL